MTKEEALEGLPQLIVDFSEKTELTPELRLARREKICQFEEALGFHPDSFGPEEINKDKIWHHFAGGVYGRELFIPKNDLIVSKIHRSKTLNIIAYGKISVISEEGFMAIEAPYVFVSKPYTKRIVIAQEATLWVTAHGTDKTDLGEIEEEVIAKDFTELNQIEGGL